MLFWVFLFILYLYLLNQAGKENSKEKKSICDSKSSGHSFAAADRGHS